MCPSLSLSVPVYPHINLFMSDFITKIGKESKRNFDIYQSRNGQVFVETHSF